MAGRGFGTARELANRAGGALFTLCFGTVWVLLGLVQTRRLAAWTGVGVGVCGVLLVVWAWKLSSRLERLAGPEPAVPTAQDAAAARAFKWANIGQYAAMFLSSVLLILLRRPEWIEAVIGIIVGLHLLPLAHWYRNPALYVTAGLLMVWGLAVLVVLPRAQMPGWAALGTGVILLASSCVTLARAEVASHAPRLPSDRVA